MVYVGVPLPEEPDEVELSVEDPGDGEVYVGVDPLGAVVPVGAV